MEVHFEPIWYEDYPGLAQRCEENNTLSSFCQELYMDDEDEAKAFFEYMTEKLIRPANIYINDHSKGSWSWVCEFLHRHSGTREDGNWYIYPLKNIKIRNERHGVTVMNEGDTYLMQFDGEDTVRPLEVRRDFLIALDWKLVEDEVQTGN